MDAFETFRLAVARFADGDVAEASRIAAGAAAEGELYAQVAQWLARAARDGIDSPYSDAKGFASYSSAGSARTFRDARIEQLARLHGELDPQSLLDLGAGDGVVTAGALERARPPRLRRIDLVEPSASLLARAGPRVRDAARGAAVREWNVGARELCGAGEPAGPWALAQAIVSLQALDRAARAPVLAWLRPACGRLVVVEFDVEHERHPRLSEERVRAIHDRYLRGIDEYTGRHDAPLEHDAKQRFLIPILFASFASGDGGSAHEQPIASWIEEIETAGFTIERTECIARHWWSDAHAIVARGARHHAEP